MENNNSLKQVACYMRIRQTKMVVVVHSSISIGPQIIVQVHHFLLASDWSKNGHVNQSWPMKCVRNALQGCLIWCLPRIHLAFCHQSGNGANTWGRAELRKEQRNMKFKIQDMKLSHKALESMNYTISLLKPVSVGISTAGSPATLVTHAKLKFWCWH